MSPLIDFIPSPVYLANRKAYREGWPVICNEGGTRSGKTFSIVQLLIHIAAKWEPGVKISIVSRSMPHLKDGALFDFKRIMRQWNMFSYAEWNATDFVYEFENGSLIKFIGMEDPEKAHGPGRDILYINEANHLKKDLYDQLSQRTTKMEFLDWNPANFQSWVYDVADDPKNKKIVSTYKNNRSNLTQKIIDKVESYEHLPDKFMWEVYGLGKRGSSEETIYRGWQLVDSLPGKGSIAYGLDFGFNHPTALIQVELYDGCYYARETLYKSGLTKPDLTEQMKQLVPAGATIYADSAEPDSIEELYRQGFNIMPSNKDVWNGIMTIKGKRLFVTRDSTNLISELQSYRWKKDKNGNILEEPVKDLDDACDALRYCIHTQESAYKINFLSIYS
jgi:phage terminase large subunit